ncbi:MAG TPA: AraC family transcriptional regulator [Puia sp.]|nr:AraC family transcriptional regulator [Puia sp.]
MVFSFNQQEYRLSREIPAELARYQIPGSSASAIANEYLKMIVQEFVADTSKVFYSVYLVDKKATFRVRDEAPFFRAYLVLQHDRNLEVAGLGKMLIKEGQFNLIYSPTIDVISHHDGVREYITLAIEYNMAVLEEWASYFPLLVGFLEKVKAGEPTTLLPRPEWITKEMQDITYKILHISLEGGANQKYFSLLVNTLLFHILYQSVQQQPASNYNHYEMDSIQAARDMIRKNIRYHFVIREIAQKVGMNEFKLKNGFRELFGNGVYEYLRSERMQVARQLLNDSGRSIKEIASLTGYRSVNSFIKAFKKMYGVTPGDFRKRA